MPSLPLMSDEEPGVSGRPGRGILVVIVIWVCLDGLGIGRT